MIRSVIMKMIFLLIIKVVQYLNIFSFCVNCYLPLTQDLKLLVFNKHHNNTITHFLYSHNTF